MLPQQLHTTFGCQRDYDKENNPKQGRRPPAHLRDHVWDSIDGWVEAEAQATKNRITAEKYVKDGIPQIFPANQKRRGISAAVRGGCSGNANEPFNHVPGEDPSKWEKAHHFKRFASRPEMVHDSVWACTGYANEGLPDALSKLLPAQSPLRSNLKTAARDQLVADGAMPPALPRYRKLWSFQKRELSLSKKLTVPPRPPQSLSEKYPDYQVIDNPGSYSKNQNNNMMIPQPPRDSCIAGCCTTCGTNLKPWQNTNLPMNIYQKQQPQRPQTGGQSRTHHQNSQTPTKHRSQTPQHLSQYAAEKRRNTSSNDSHHLAITLPRSYVVSGTSSKEAAGSKKWQTTNNRVFNTRAASASNQRKRTFGSAAATH